jgi:ribonuclease J
VATLTFHGGVGEIGGNKILLEDRDTRVFLDFGMSFSMKGAFYEEFLQPRTNNGLRDLIELGIVPGIDGIYRDDLLSIDGIENVIQELGCNDNSLWISSFQSYDTFAQNNNRPFIQGVLISHGHLDHFQYISLLDEKIPVYCSATTSTIIETAEAIGKGGFEFEFTAAKRRSLSTTGTRAYFPGVQSITSDPVPREFVILKDHTTIGNIDVQSFPIDHSVPGATGFLIATSDSNTIAYTGDLRFHGTRSELTENFRKALIDSRPDVLIVEGTRIEDDVPDSESSVEERCYQLVSQTEGLAMVGFAWKDITRYQTMKRVAERNGRILVISPKLAFLLYRLKQFTELNITDISTDKSVAVYLKRKDGMLYSKGDYVSSKYDAGYSVDWDRKDPATIDLEHFTNGIRAYQIKQDPSRYVLHLDYYDFNELIDLNPPASSTYIRASSEPFNIEMELDEERLISWLKHFDINAPKHEPQYIHASGHASGPEIQQFIRDIGPKVVFPVHTEKPEKFVEIVPQGTRVVIPEVGTKYTVERQ